MLVRLLTWNLSAPDLTSASTHHRWTPLQIGIHLHWFYLFWYTDSHSWRYRGCWQWQIPTFHKDHIPGIMSSTSLSKVESRVAVPSRLQAHHRHDIRGEDRSLGRASCWNGSDGIQLMEENFPRWSGMGLMGLQQCREIHERGLEV